MLFDDRPMKVTCAKAPMASLGTLCVDDDEHPALKAACEARGIELYELY